MSNSTFTSTTPSTTSSQVSISESSSIQVSVSSSIASSVSSEILSRTSSAAPVTVIVTNTASSAAPTTEVFTSIVTQTPTNGGSTSPPVTVVVTSVSTAPTSAAPTEASSTRSSVPSSTSSSPASLANNGSSNGSGGNGGLSTAGKTAIAVVVPVVVVALLVLAALLLWRKRKQKKAAEEQRRKEVEDYGFNPNNDPTLPAVASESPEMTEDHSSGYRGWGAATGSNRKASTTLSGGHTHGQLSDAGSNPYGPSSPSGGNSDDRSGDPLVNRRETMNSDELGALGAAPVAGAAAGAGAMRRGPSNASSRYSNGARSEGSDEPVPQLPPLGQSYDYNQGGFQGYSQAGPYGDGSYGGGQQENGMPIVRDVSARRNTRIQQGGTYQQGNSGIAQNF